MQWIANTAFGLEEHFGGFVLPVPFGDDGLVQQFAQRVGVPPDDEVYGIGRFGIDDFAGIAAARDLRGEDYESIAVIGDAKDPETAASFERQTFPENAERFFAIAEEDAGKRYRKYKKMEE